MENIKDIQFLRKIKVNRLLINFRWFYVIIIFLAVLFFQQAHSPETFRTDFLRLAFIVLGVYIVNLFFYFVFLKIEKSGKMNSVALLSFLQIATEIVFLGIIMQCAPDIKGFIYIFFFLPIVTSSLMFYFSGALVMAVISIIIVALPSLLEYIFQTLIGGQYIPRIGGTVQQYNFVENISAAVCYLVVGLFSGYGANLLREHEQLLELSIIKIKEEKEAKIKEIERHDHTAQLLIERDIDLTKMNVEYNKKIVELEKSKESLLVAFKDVQKAGQEIEEEKNITLTILSNFTSPIIVLDKFNKIVLFNPAARKILGIRFLDYGRKIQDKDNYSLENFKDVIGASFTFTKLDEKPSEGIILTEEIVIKNKNQDLTFKVITGKISGDGKGNLGIMKIFNDVTREKVLDKLKSEFISVAAHQLRTPLAAIKWIFELILSGDTGEVNAEQKTYLNKGHESNERIISLVNDLLNVSRIEEGRYGYEFTQQDLLVILNEILWDVKSTAEKNNLKITFNKPDNLPLMNLDREKISMVLQNVIENAVKYTPEHGKVDINLKKENDNIILEVIDNGVGIPAKDQEKLFTKFFRATNVVRMQTEGTGLGLFIAKNIIEKHRGTIKLESKEGKGTKVTITFPYK